MFHTIQKFQINSAEPIFLGVDEVGRGSLIGPVITTTVLFNSKIPFINEPPCKIDDSKKMTKKNRKRIIDWLNNEPAISYSISSASINEIEELNIRNANNLAMNRSIISEITKTKYKLIHNSYKINKTTFKCYIDGNYFLPIDELIKLLEYHKYNLTFETIIKGDSKNIAIALASIIAKEYRDDLIINISKQYPKYNWANNMGYGTKQHFQAILKNGITIHHRLSFLKKLISA